MGHPTRWIPKQEKQKKGWATRPADYYANLRYESSSLGRFFQPDPVGGDPTNPQSWNRYAYALNDPLNLVDSLGLDAAGNAPDLNYVCYSDGTCDTSVSGGSSITVNGGDAGSGFFGEGCCGGDPGPFPLLLRPFGGRDGGGGGGNTANNNSQPQPKPKGTNQRIECANNFANNHSLAALFGAQNTLLGKALGGNAIAGAGELYLAVAAKEGTNPVALGTGIAVGGAGLGISPVGGPGIKGAAGILQDAVVMGTATAANNAIHGVGSTPITVFTAESTLAAEEAVQLSTETLEHVATGVGTAKLVLDAGIYFYALSQCR